MNTITREQLQSELASPQLVLLEALPEPYFKSGHLPGARWFPMQQARELAKTIAPDASVVVYCASETCKNSHQVAKLLEDAGYTNIRVYVGGKADWQAAGLPVEV